MKILIVDDDLDLRPVIAFSLRQGGFLALEAGDGASALELVESELPDLVVLDLNLPDVDGFEVCRRLREAGHRLPVLMLTVRGDEEDLVRGLEIGADDYLTKPFSPRTLVARVRALLRRSEQQTAAIQRYGAVELDEGLQALRLGERPPVRLTRLEFRLVQLLMVHQGQPVATERLLRHVWGAAAGDDRQLLKQLVHRLRHKLEDDPAEPRWLCTVPGVGYCLAIGEDSATPPSQE